MPNNSKIPSLPPAGDVFLERLRDRGFPAGPPKERRLPRGEVQGEDSRKACQSACASRLVELHRNMLRIGSKRKPGDALRLRPTGGQNAGCCTEDDGGDWRQSGGSASSSTTSRKSRGVEVERAVASSDATSLGNHHSARLHEVILCATKSHKLSPAGSRCNQDTRVGVLYATQQAVICPRATRAPGGAAPPGPQW